MLSESPHMILLSDYGVTSYDIGTGFGHFAIATPDVSQSLLSQKLDNLFAPSVLKLKLISLPLLGLQNG